MSLGAPPRDRVGARFELRARLGQGGSSTVVEAYDHESARLVALKRLDPSLCSSAELRARFGREARALSSLHSPYIVRILASGTEDERPFLAMERLHGEDLGARLRRAGRLPVNETVHIATQVLQGLAAAHASNIVHRDLKPDNVFLVSDGAHAPHVKLLDFGVSKLQPSTAATQAMALTGQGRAMGTPLYMSPEQARGLADVDARADLYAVGAIMFECLSGRPPHPGETDAEVLVSVCTREAPNLRTLDPSIPAALASFVARALDRDRERRWASAELMRADLEALARGVDRPWPWRITLVAALAIVAGILVTLGLLALSERETHGEEYRGIDRLFTRAP